MRQFCLVIIVIAATGASGNAQAMTLKAFAQHANVIRAAGPVNICGSNGCVRVQTHRIVRQKSGNAMANHI